MTMIIGQTGGLIYDTHRVAVDKAQELSAWRHGNLFSVHEDPQGWMVVRGVQQHIGAHPPIAQFMNGRRIDA